MYEQAAISSLLYICTKMYVYGNKRSRKVDNSANYYVLLNDLNVNTLASPATIKSIGQGQNNLFIVAHILTG